jgi:acyl carrier protein
VNTNTPTTPITGDSVRALLEDAIGSVAPDVVDEVATIDADRDLFEEFGLDSMDRLSIMEALVAATGVDIPEEKYVKLSSVNAIRDHLSA